MHIRSRYQMSSFPSVTYFAFSCRMNCIGYLAGQFGCSSSVMIGMRDATKPSSSACAITLSTMLFSPRLLPIRMIRVSFPRKRTSDRNQSQSDASTVSD